MKRAETSAIIRLTEVKLQTWYIWVLIKPLTEPLNKF